MPRLVSAASFATSVATEINCTIDDAQGGRKQIWVPKCRGKGCFANDVDQSCAWCVYDLGSCLAAYGNVDCHEILAHRRAQNAGCIDVGRDAFEVPGYGCDGSETVIAYPKGDGPCPVVLYGHGMAPNGAVDGRMEAMAHVAANGLLVLAPNTGGYDGRGRTCGSSSEWKDMILAVTASRDGGAALHPALATANWDHVGMWGYSMGG